jgi:beta-aspartyl-dipeptidase (metallo-type)
MPITVIRQGNLYAPEPIGVQSLVLADSKILYIGDVDIDQLSASGVPVDVIDADDCVVVPGFIDPHQHIVGAGGENGFASRMPEVSLSQIINAGITTVVGLLGTDTTTRHLLCLHAKTCQLQDEGITALMYTGGFEIPPRTITDSVLDDIVMMDKVIGTGEIAISDHRWVNPDIQQLAHIVIATALGGKMGGKAGVTHFHVGERDTRMQLLYELLDDYEVAPESIYATHITRSEALMNDAIDLAKRGVYVDIDTVEENLGDCLDYYLKHGGPPDKLTFSSDAHTPGGSPEKFYAQFVSCVRDHHFPLEQMLALCTSNTAKVLKLDAKGALREGRDSDVLVLQKESLEIKHLFARGRQLIRDGQQVDKSVQEKQLEESMP